VLLPVPFMVRLPWMMTGNVVWEPSKFVVKFPVPWSKVTLPSTVTSEMLSSPLTFAIHKRHGDIAADHGVEGIVAVCRCP